MRSDAAAVDAAAARRIDAVVIGASAGGFEAMLAVLKEIGRASCRERV